MTNEWTSSSTSLSLGDFGFEFTCSKPLKMMMLPLCVQPAIMPLLNTAVVTLITGSMIRLWFRCCSEDQRHCIRRVSHSLTRPSAPPVTARSMPSQAASSTGPSCSSSMRHLVNSKLIPLRDGSIALFATAIATWPLRMPQSTFAVPPSDISRQVETFGANSTLGLPRPIPRRGPVGLRYPERILPVRGSERETIP